MGFEIFLLQERGWRMKNEVWGLFGHFPLKVGFGDNYRGLNSNTQKSSIFTVGFLLLRDQTKKHHSQPKPKPILYI
ncbi:hypothetical protein RIF29_34685 [Crotalaria pallida]|uniref:Uncharacterized protein n=1 Tax=Crotalaria pallida TaxID=3830 RepID=A0AAN9EF23_CROPI